MFFNEEFETLPRPALEALQLKRLQERLSGFMPTSRFTDLLLKRPESSPPCKKP